MVLNYQKISPIQICYFYGGTEKVEFFSFLSSLIHKKKLENSDFLSAALHWTSKIMNIVLQISVQKLLATDISSIQMCSTRPFSLPELHGLCEVQEVAYQALLLPIRLGPACRAVLSGLMECSITLVSESIVSTVRGGRDLLRRDLFQVSSQKEEPFLGLFWETGGLFSSLSLAGESLLNLKFSSI